MKLFAETDEELLEKFLEDADSITIDELKAALRKATISNEIVPMLCGTSYRNKGVQNAFGRSYRLYAGSYGHSSY